MAAIFMATIVSQGLNTIDVLKDTVQLIELE